MDSLRLNLTAGGALTVAFLIGQLVAWRQLTDAGYFVTTNPADAFFYILTGLHGLHMLGGLWFLAQACLSAWGKPKTSTVMEIADVRLRVELCSVYWHYLLLIWLLLFGLFLST